MIVKAGLVLGAPRHDKKAELVWECQKELVRLKWELRKTEWEATKKMVDILTEADQAYGEGSNEYMKKEYGDDWQKHMIN